VQSKWAREKTARATPGAGTKVLSLREGKDLFVRRKQTEPKMQAEVERIRVCLESRQAVASREWRQLDFLPSGRARNSWGLSGHRRERGGLHQKENGRGARPDGIMYMVFYVNSPHERGGLYGEKTGGGEVKNFRRRKSGGWTASVRKLSAKMGDR